MDIIEGRNLTVGYGSTRVLGGMEFAVPRGKVTVVAGISGSGKSTLLKTLAGLLPPLGGKVVFAGTPVDFSSEASLRSLYRRIGVLYQDGALLNNLNLFENVALPVRMEYPGIPEDIIREMVEARLEQVGLEGNEAKWPAQLSGGMRKRGALARALVLDPDVVLCDEPSGGLDPITSAHLDDLLISVKDTFGTTLVIVTHELRSIERMADRILVLNNGGLYYTGEFSPLASSSDEFIRTFFLRKECRNDP
jgi:phospholipid/cholesterol/gamma-HCH transport system ATP-binding protein